jgi:hypothetical protein
LTGIEWGHAVKVQRSKQGRKGSGALSALLVLGHWGVAHAQAPAPSDSLPAPEPATTESATEPLPPDRVVQVASASPPATATEPPLPDPPSAKSTLIDRLVPEVHGFVSQGFIKSTANNYLANSEQGSFEFTEVGINFTSQVTDRMRVGMQLFMRDLGPIGNYKPQFDWFYLDYRFFDWLGIRAGRTKIPFGLYNEINDIDAARVPVLLPQSVYPTANRDFLLAQTGGEVYGDIPLGPVGSLEYRAYGGTIYLDTSTNEAVKNLNIPFVVGGRLTWQTPLDGLRIGGTVQSLRLDWDAILTPEQLAMYQASGALPPEATNELGVRFPLTLSIASIEYSAHDVLVAAEYSQWAGDVYTELAPTVPFDSTVSERFYVMASFRAASWFSPGMYYSYIAPRMADRSGAAGEQHDVAVTARYDINDHWLVKLEGHYMHGTADLNPALNDGTPAAELVPDWGLFLIKTTAYF